MSSTQLTPVDDSGLKFWFVLILVLGCFAITYKLQYDLRSSEAEIATLKAQLGSKDKAIDELKISLNVYKDVEREQRAEAEAKQLELERKLEAKKTRADFIQNEVKCLADNIYHEAAYEPEKGQLAVATVTMNRVANAGYPKTVCGVVYERHLKKSNDKIVCMFSWTCKPRVMVHPTIYKQIMDMARGVYFKHDRLDEVADAVLYHAVYVHPNWGTDDTLVAQIGLHMFYRQQ
jgi:spore germination cell wall hydrolase CwlJ-like protein